MPRVLVDAHYAERDDGGMPYVQGLVSNGILWLVVLASAAGACTKRPDQNNGNGSATTSAVVVSPAVDWSTSTTRAFSLIDGPRKGRNAAVARKLFADACDHGDQRGCTGLGITYLDGIKGTDKDGAKAVKLLTVACDTKVARACSALAAMYDDGLAVAKDTRKAIELARSSCDAGEQRGCARYAAALIEGSESVLKDPKLKLPRSGGRVGTNVHAASA